MNSQTPFDTTAADYIVQVDFIPETLELRPSVLGLSVLPGSNVLLKFNNLPVGWSPLMEFRQADGDSVMAAGPFEQLIVGRTQALGVNARSDIAQYDFRALIQRGFGSHSVNDAAVIFAHWLPFSLLEEPVNGRVVEVKVKEKDGELSVDRPQITIREGLRVRWDFSQVAREHHQPLVVYGRPLVAGDPVEGRPGDGRSEEFFGPHESFIYTGNRAVEGNGNNGIKGIYRYAVYLLDVRTRSIVIRSSSDPQTDNEGDSSSTGPTSSS